MGVTATMTVSLLRNGDLWGLIAAHHYRPKLVDADVRYATETVGHALVSRIVQLEDARTSAAHVLARDAVHEFIVRAVTGSLESLARDRALHEALGVHGAAYVNGAVVTSGSVPQDDELRALVAWLTERGGTERFATDTLAKLNPAFVSLAAIASGVYAARVRKHWFLAFRGEQRQTVDWGGDPAKPAQTDGNNRLSPRGSFALWREEVTGRALPWEDWTLDALDRAFDWSRGPDLRG